MEFEGGVALRPPSCRAIFRCSLDARGSGGAQPELHRAAGHAGAAHKVSVLAMKLSASIFSHSSWRSFAPCVNSGEVREPGGMGYQTGSGQQYKLRIYRL